MTEAFAWFGAVVILIIIEMFTMGLTTIWFAMGALVSAIAALFGASLVVQLLLFLIVSVVLLVFTRPWAKRFLNNRTVKTNSDSLIGQRAKVTIQICNRNEQGQILVRGLNWTARSCDDDVIIPAGSEVVITAISGVKCMVRPLSYGKEESDKEKTQ